MKPESLFIHRVHKLLPEIVYAEKTHNMYRGGTPDCFYEGIAEDLWVEYKWIPKLPARVTTLVSLDLSELQKRWLKRRYEKSRAVWAVLGYKEKTKTRVCLFSSPREWERSYTKEELSNWSVPIEDYIKTIKAATCY